VRKGFLQRSIRQESVGIKRRKQTFFFKRKDVASLRFSKMKKAATESGARASVRAAAAPFSIRSFSVGDINFTI